MFILCAGIQLHAQQTDGRYKILSTTSGQYAETYMLDKKSGRVWMMRGQVSQTPALIPCVYQLVNGEITSLPMERHSEISLLADKMSLNGTLQDSQGEFDNPSQLPPQKLPPDAQKKLDDASKKMDEDMKKLFPK